SALMQASPLRYPRNILVGGAYAEIQGVPTRVITVSHPNAWDALRSGSAPLPANTILAGRRPPSGTIPKQLHVERVAAAALNGSGAGGGLVTTSSPTCESCSRVWRNGILFGRWLHLNWVEW